MHHGAGRYNGIAAMASMSEARFVALLGKPAVRIGSDWLRFRSDMRFQLLAYLARDGDWVDRERLAFLFWPDTDSATARRQLSQLLKRLRRLEWLGELEGDRHRLRWRVDSDVAAFEAALDRDDHSEALSRYRGFFLEDFGRNLGAEVEAWIEGERAHLHSRWREAVLERADALGRSGDHRGVTTTLEALLALEPFDEEALQLLLAASIRAGRSEQAQRAYRAFAAGLRSEFGLEPSLATQALIEELARGVPRVTARVAVSDRSAPTLPVDGTPFVGRDLELAEIAHRLSQTGSRLVTITGPGGAGKSRLALQAARELAPSYPDGVFFVALETLSESAQLPGAIASALGLDPGHDPWREIAALLGSGRRLLILDNFEHLVDAAPRIAELLASCPELVCLATSRERLDLREEWLLPLGGMSYPGHGDLAVADALRFDAVQLFVAQTRRVRPDYRLASGDLAPIIDICRLTRGLPLALELAAAWMRVMDCAEIRSELDRDLDLLSGGARDIPERQRSIRATFEHSWRLLTPAERTAFATLSVFRGGFRREAAAVVADVSLALLAALVDKSLLRPSDDGRYDRHPLLHHYGREKLAEHPEARAAAETRHARYFLDLLQRRYGELRGSHTEQLAALDGITAERENLRVAWHTALDRGWAHRVERAIEPLERFLQRRGHIAELSALFAAAAAAFEDAAEHTELLGLLLAKQGWYVHRSGDLEAATALSERALDLLGTRNPGVGRGQALNTLGFVAQHRGDYARAKYLLRRALRIARALDDPWYVAGFGNNLAIVEFRLGDLAAAAALFEASLELNRDANDLSEIAINLLNFGTVIHAQGDSARAERMYLEGLERAREIGFTAIQPFFLLDLSNIALDRGEFETALGRCREALDRLQTSPEQHFRAECLNQLGRIELALGEADTAGAHIDEALRLALSLEHAPSLLHSLISVAKLHTHHDRNEDAARLLALVLAQPTIDHTTRTGVESMLGELRDVLGPAPFDTAVAAGGALDLHETARGQLRSSVFGNERSG